MTSAWRIATLHQSLAPSRRQPVLLATSLLIALLGHLCIALSWPTLTTIAEAARSQAVIPPPPPQESLQYIVLPDTIDDDEEVNPDKSLAQARNSRQSRQKSAADQDLEEGDPTSEGKSHVNNSAYESKPSSASEPALAQILPQTLAQEALQPVQPTPPQPQTRPTTQIQKQPMPPQPQQPSEQPEQPKPPKAEEAPVLSALPAAPKTDAILEAEQQKSQDVPEPVLTDEAKPDLTISKLPKDEHTAAPRPTRRESEPDQTADKEQSERPTARETQQQTPQAQQPPQTPTQPVQPQQQQTPQHRTPPPVKKIGPKSEAQERKSAVTRKSRARLSSTDSLALLKSRYGAYMDKVILRLEQSVRRIESLGLGASGEGVIKSSFRINQNGEIIDITIISAPDGMLREQNIVKQIYEDAYAQGKFSPPDNSMLKDPDFSPIIVNFWFE